jgi:hypothetical protein
MDHATARLSEIVPERWSFLILWVVLRDIMLDPRTGTLVLIIDAIDEYESSSRNRILAAIKRFLAQKLDKSFSTIKLLLSSRNNLDLREQIEEFSEIICLDGLALTTCLKLDGLSKIYFWLLETS